jgi:MFS transporter, DHA3 family, macrolide efflux protein
MFYLATVIASGTSVASAHQTAPRNDKPLVIEFNLHRINPMTYQAPPNGFRTFLILWVTQSISVFGSALTFFSVTIWLTQTLYPAPEQKAELALALSAVSIAFALPTVFGAPIAGAWADRHDRKRTMMITDAANGVLSLALAMLMTMQSLNLSLLIALVAISAMLGSFHYSAFDTSYAMIVPEKQLARANGMMQTVQSLSGVLSPTIAAMLISLPALARQGLLPIASLARLTDGAPLAITMDAITFFLAAAMLPFLFIPSPRRTDLHDASGVKKSFWADIQEGALYIWHRKPLLWLLGTFTVANFAGSPLGVFMPLVVKFNLASDWSARGFTFETAFALIGSVGGIGGIIGGVAISTWGGLKSRRVYGVVVALLVQAFAMIALGFSSGLFLAATMVFFFHSMGPVTNAHSQAIWQTQTPRELQGRVFSVRRLIAQFTWPLSTALAGVLGGLFNPGTIIVVLESILAVFCIAQMFNPYLMRVEDKAWLDSLARPHEENANQIAE